MSDLEALIRGLRDADPEIRATSAEALGKSGEVGGVAALAAALSDPDPRVRLKAEEALQQTEEGRAVCLIIEVLQAALASY